MAVLLDEIDDDDDENVWLSEAPIKAEESEGRLPRWVEGTTVCVDVLDREDDEDDEDEQDGAGEPDRGEIEVGNGTVFNGWRATIAWVYRELRDVLRYYTRNWDN